MKLNVSSDLESATFLSSLHFFPAHSLPCPTDCSEDGSHMAATDTHAFDGRLSEPREGEEGRDFYSSHPQLPLSLLQEGRWC